ncbi:MULTISPECIES: hypothetical protein [Flavobacteriaceae]|jgi:hypothetical protein|uniref:Uncharacterized protein n=1 Tax=Meridianimaribacter flavus TaxID=571115 RepID=A0ABY2G5B5_9FLAO|nr:MULTISPECIES: hypothetical protein [Meridianimaribacter]RYH74047.1 hypothetical protein EVU94_08635 [Flavobacteriaceae bacterium 144Ye]TBV25951.1 hypothetical protein DMZ43_08555 [Meridianimaribacter sp. CL38]TDY11320.1 hypothetical protein A8975_1957 [Meridianimaribacter flavus]
MKTKFTILMMVFFLAMSNGFAQKKDEAQNIISGKVSITKYHDREDLEKMQKGELLDLYTERIEVIVNILPNIAFATKPGITMTSLGIPDTKDNRKALEDNKNASKIYFDSTIEFQKKVLPYSDKSNLIAAILFYEQTLKSLHTYNEFNN